MGFMFLLGVADRGESTSDCPLQLVFVVLCICRKTCFCHIQRVVMIVHSLNSYECHLCDSSLPPEYKLSDAENNVGCCTRLQSVVLGSIFSGPTTSQIGKQCVLCFYFVTDTVPLLDSGSLTVLRVYTFWDSSLLRLFMNNVSLSLPQSPPSMLFALAVQLLGEESDFQVGQCGLTGHSCCDRACPKFIHEGVCESVLVWVSAWLSFTNIARP